MTYVVLPPSSDPPVLPRTGSPHARYNFLARNILSSFAESGGISLVVADSSLDSGFLREAIEQVHNDLDVFEVPCRQASSGIIARLPQFLSSASAAPDALARPGTTSVTVARRHGPMVFICDGADLLDDEQIETMYSISRGTRGPLGVVLLAKPEFLLRMQSSNLTHIKAALAACFWSQHSSYGAVYAADAQEQDDGLMPLNLAQLPLRLQERLAPQTEEDAQKPHLFSVLQKLGVGSWRFGSIRGNRRKAVTVLFSLGYLLVGGCTAYMLSWVSAHQHAPASNSEAVPPLREAISSPPPGPEAAPTDRIRPYVTPRAVTASPLVENASDAPVTAALSDATEKRAPNALPQSELEVRENDRPPPLPSEKLVGGISPRVSVMPKQEPSKPNEKLPDGDRVLFAQRGNELLMAGDIASARLFLERAANAGDAASALGMAKTFDPVELAKAGVRGVEGDQAKAEFWYQRARLLAGIGTSGSK